MALYVLFENENAFVFLSFTWLLLNLQMCQIILPDFVVERASAARSEFNFFVESFQIL